MRTTPRQVMDDIPPTIPAEPIRFLDQLRAFIRSQNKSWATEKTYILWIKRYIHFHQKKHPKDMGEIEIEKFLNHLVLQKHCSHIAYKSDSLLGEYKSSSSLPVRTVDLPAIPQRCRNRIDRQLYPLTNARVILTGTQAFH